MPWWTETSDSRGPACRTFLAINGQSISAPEDERFDLVIRVATGVLPDLDKIADQLRTWSYQEG
jgi:death-on-curing protein